MSKIQDFINERHKYKIDTNYQRPPGAWSKEDKQCLIDSILRNEPIPLFFLNVKDGVYFIVDGQQRLDAIKDFYDNKIKLNKKFSGEENQGKTFNGDKPLSDEQREMFLNYKLQFKLMEDYDDERIRMVFSRLQRGKPLTLGERLNAKPGEIVLRMREIASHPFMSKSIGISKNRYGNFPDAARILFYEKSGCKDSGTDAIMAFFENNKKMDKSGKDYKNIIMVLDFLEKCFPANPGDYHFLSRHAWVLSVYTMIRELINGYVLKGKEDVIKSFIEDFHNKVYSEDFRASNSNYQRFYDNVRGGWSEKIIRLRRNILINEFLKKNDIAEKDEKRQISEEEKIACFARYPKCQMCGKSFKDYKSAEYHHRIMHSEGGKSSIENIMVLCSDCHKKIHGNEKVELPTEDEIPDGED